MEERTYIVLTGLEGNPPPQTTPAQERALLHMDLLIGLWTGLLILTVMGVIYWIVAD
jgi:hypothetical protein